jgi:hypothetical protein
LAKADITAHKIRQFSTTKSIGRVAEMVQRFFDPTKTGLISQHTIFRQSGLDKKDYSRFISPKLERGTAKKLKFDEKIEAVSPHIPLSVASVASVEPVPVELVPSALESVPPAAEWTSEYLPVLIRLYLRYHGIFKDEVQRAVLKIFLFRCRSANVIAFDPSKIDVYIAEYSTLNYVADTAFLPAAYVLKRLEAHGITIWTPTKK